MTAQWALRLSDGSSMDRHPEIGAQIFRLVLARALAMCRRLQAGGIQPILFLDEPGLYGFTTANPRHVMGLQELKLMSQALRKEGIWVGLHCCSNTDWGRVLELGLDFISLDTHLSLAALLDHPAALDKFLAEDGRLSLGVIPTSGPPESWQKADVRLLFAELVDALGMHWRDRPEQVHRLLRRSLYTPACGLALHSPRDAETILAALKEFRQFSERSLKN